MNKKDDSLTLEQIYDFVVEQPGFKTKGKQQQLLDFLSVIHEDPNKEIMMVSADKIIFKYGQRRIIKILEAPPLRNKIDFLSWIYKQLHS